MLLLKHIKTLKYSYVLLVILAQEFCSLWGTTKVYLFLYTLTTMLTQIN